MDKNGLFEWEKTYGSTEDDAAYDLLYEPVDSRLVLVGKKGNYPWLLKTNKFGDTLWTKTFVDSVVFLMCNS